MKTCQVKTTDPALRLKIGEELNRLANILQRSTNEQECEAIRKRLQELTK